MLSSSLTRQLCTWGLIGIPQKIYTRSWVHLTFVVQPSSAVRKWKGSSWESLYVCCLKHANSSHLPSIRMPSVRSWKILYPGTKLLDMLSHIVPPLVCVVAYSQVYCWAGATLVSWTSTECVMTTRTGKEGSGHCGTVSMSQVGMWIYNVCPVHNMRYLVHTMCGV